MAQGEFTKEEAEETKTAVEEMYTALPKNKKVEFVGHLNDVLMFLSAAQKVAPSEKK